MVTNITSLTGNGLKDWLIQRVSAVYLLVYTIFALGYFITHHQIDYVIWQQAFHCKFIQMATVLAVVAILLHAWIGIWTIITDYIKCQWLRLAAQMAVAFCLCSEGLWAIFIVWGQ